MFERLEKLRSELDKAVAKRAELDAKVKELERKCKEEENSQIHGMVHAMNMTPEQLQMLLAQFASGNVPGNIPNVQTVNVSDVSDDYEDLEGESDEDN